MEGLMISNVQVSKEHRDAPNFEILCSNMDETDRNVLSKRSKSEHSFKHFPECNALLMQMLFSNSGAQSPTGRIAQVRIAYGNKCLNNNIFCSAALKLTHPKSHFDMQSFKNGYICSTFISCHTFTTFPLLQPWLLPEALLTKSLRIMDVSEAVHYNGFVMTVDAGIKLFSHTVCSVCKAEDGHGSSIIDPSALCKEPIGLSIPLCTLNPAESQSLTRFYESSNIPITLLTSRYQSLHEFLIEVNSFTSYLERSLLLCAASKLTKHEMIGFQILSCLALLYIDRIKLLMLLLKEKNSQAPMLALASSTIATSCIAVCSASPQQSYTMRTNITSLRIPLKIEELLKAQQSNGDELITDIISLIAFPSLNDKERIEESYVFQYDYVIPVRKPTTSMDIASQACTSAVQSLVCESNKSIGGTILRANPGDNQIKVHHSLSLVPVTTVTSCQDYFQRYFDILTTVSPQCLLSCVSLYPICHVFVATHDLVKRNSVIAIKQFKNLQLLSVSSNNVQVQISRFSDLGMFKQHHKDPRVEVVNANPPPSHHICRKSPPSRNNSKRSIHKRTSNKIRKCASFLKRCLHQSDYHYMYQKLLWSQLKGKKMNSFSLRKGLMLYCNTWSVSLHSSLKYHRAERHTTHSGDSLNAFMIHRAIEESRGFGRRVALFRGGKPSTQKSDPSDNDSDSGDGHAGAATSHEIPTSSHEASHSNGAMNLRPSSEAPPPLKMNSGVSQPGGEADRYVQSSQSPAALITKSSEQPLHSQGVSNNYIEPLQDKQVLFMPSAAANIGYQDSDNIMQPKLECYEDEDKPLGADTRPQILEQAQEEVSPVLTTGQHDEYVLMSAQFNPSMYYRHSNAHQMHPRVPNIDNHPAPCPMVVTCSIPVSISITGPGIMAFGAIVEEASGATVLPSSCAQAEINHKCQRTVLRQLRGLVLLMRFRCDRISHLLLQSPNNSYNNQLQVIRCALREIVHEMRCIHHRWHVSQLRVQHIQALLLHTNSPPCHRARLIELT